MGVESGSALWVIFAVSTAFDTAFACAIATTLLLEWFGDEFQEPVNFSIISFTKVDKCDGVVSRFSTPSLEPPFCLGVGYVASRRPFDI